MAVFFTCPVCGSVAFYVKDPEDGFETHEFTLTDGSVVTGSAAAAALVAAGAEIYCGRCSWHGTIPGVRNV